ncbi:choice-of-anchor H family protein [Shewanella waksmanii]|uniref:choice-of-anchor H family protein n=1 Tax=Shewanella waksmanii TaxID=213783 RepID=UPI0037358B2E
MKPFQQIKESVLRSSPKLQRRVQSALWLGCCVLIMTVNSVAADEAAPVHKGVSSVEFNQAHQYSQQQKQAALQSRLQQSSVAAAVAVESMPEAEKYRLHKQDIVQGMSPAAVKAIRADIAAKQSVTAADIFSADLPMYREFAIYDAYSRMFTDNNGDGYYQTFSVTFDADVYGYYVGERAQVFADLYLSRNGGPWKLYYTTDIFTIIDDNTDDDFEVLSTLHTGYPTDSYDVLIDLYELGNPNIVATFSSDDSDSLYALPLQSSDYDVDYVEVVEVSGGALGVGALALLLLLGYRRRG